MWLCVFLNVGCIYFDNNIIVRPKDAVTMTWMRPFSKICVRDAGRVPSYISVLVKNVIVMGYFSGKREREYSR